MLMRVRATCCSHKACLGPNFSTNPHTQPSFACHAQVGPQVGLKLAKLEPIAAKLDPSGLMFGPNLKPRTAKFDPVGFWLGQVIEHFHNKALRIRAFVHTRLFTHLGNDLA